MKLRTRMGLAAALVVAGALGAVMPVLYRAESRIVAEQFDTSLANIAQQTTQPAFGIQFKSVYVGDAGLPPATPIEFEGDLVQVADAPYAGGGPAGLPLFDSLDVDVFDGLAPSYAANVDYRGTVYRIYTTRIAHDEPPTGSEVVYTTGYTLVRVARPLSDETAPLHRLAMQMIALTCGAALAAVLVMALLTRRILRPARTLTTAVEHVTATGDLTTDLGVSERRRGRDELTRLAASFAVMMRALDDSHQAQRRLVADASHELRTPLTSLTTNLDLLDEISASPDPLTPELVRDARTQAYELRTLVNDLIDLARYTSVETHTEDTRLDLLAERVVKRARDLATARTREIVFETDLEECVAEVDPDAVHRAISNLLDNAIKWSPAGGVIRVELRRTADGAAELGVRDEGPGIPPDDLPHVFDRFYRSPSARAMPGSGLGLAIVRQIAEQHHGTVHARPSSAGAHILLRLPLR
ncbi:MAG TPA: HAMP domain-containing sensor histidine kinase [Actinospica sp.]|nr:HAMP domain-containing sensor histidine kinase [Actinospica sp.]